MGAAHAPEGWPDLNCVPAGEFSLHDYMGIGGPLAPTDGSTATCPGGDGHAEWAMGGAILDGSHHSNHICARDILLADPVVFTVNGVLAVDCGVFTPASVYVVSIQYGAFGHVFSVS